MITLVLTTLMLTMTRVDGEFERAVEVDMYGSRPGNVDSLVIPSREGYYKYEELSEPVTISTGTTDTSDTSTPGL